MGQLNDICDDGDLMIQFQVKVLEQQLEQEHEERINFLRERHELEGKIMGLQVNKMFKTSPEISPERLIYFIIETYFRTSWTEVATRSRLRS